MATVAPKAIIYNIFQKVNTEIHLFVSQFIFFVGFAVKVVHKWTFSGFEVNLQKAINVDTFDVNLKLSSIFFNFFVKKTFKLRRLTAYSRT